MAYVFIKYGTYRNNPVVNTAFPLVDDYKETPKKKFITVDGSHMGFGSRIRINLTGPEQYSFIGEDSYLKQAGAAAVPADLIPSVGPAVTETDEEIEARIRDSFEVLDLMTDATIGSEIRAMIVTGPPGVGKSYGVEQKLEKAGLFDKLRNDGPKYGFMKGVVTPIALYATLFKYSDAGSVIVFDDCDAALQDEDCLNMLKCALDSGKKRVISWNASRSTYLEQEGIPESFDFKGSAIFITNLDFTSVRSKKMAAHLEALMSRCHYLDLTMNTMKEKFIRIRQVAETGNLFSDYNFSPEDEAELLNFMYDNKEHLREVSLRMCLKIADLRRMAPMRWQSLARSTCMKPMGRFAKMA